jgi:predicted MPP superfamily phosphohydrolase
MSKILKDSLSSDGVDRRGFLRCMAWAGTGVVWTINGGVPASKLLGQSQKGDGFQFVQISDSHIGFNKPANADVNATLRVAIDKINALPQAPDFLIHTGDLTHLAKPAEFDTLGQLLQEAKAKQVYYVPGEHDNASDDGKEYLERYGKGSKGSGWYSLDHHGVHFVGLVNSAALEGMGSWEANNWPG